jgi:hypothetical protein
MVRFRECNHYQNLQYQPYSASKTNQNAFSFFLLRKIRKLNILLLVQLFDTADHHGRNQQEPYRQEDENSDAHWATTEYQHVITIE